VHVTLEDAWVSQDGGAFLRNVWPMYVHELSGFGADFYQLDGIGRWQPDIVEQWIARITPAANLRGVRSHDHAEQPFQRGHVIRVAAERVGFVCVGVRPFRYMPDGFDYTIAELFVVHRYRGAGAAQQAVGAVLRRYPGRGHLCAIRGNARAIAFWRRALPALGVRQLSEAQEPGELVWTFRTDGPTGVAY
jgi:predicted acetyltransferase